MEKPQQLAEKAREQLSKLLERDEPLKPKDRMAIPPQEMPQQDPEARRSNMEEVALGYTPEQARLEAMRCLQCKNAPCISGCPVEIDIPGFLAAAAEGNFKEAAEIIKRDSLLPAVCGRVCPQETQCQAPCTLGKALRDPEKAVSIGRVERFVIDWERENNQNDIPLVAEETGKKIAIVGSGPAGITVAADLRRKGHDVTILEAFHKPGGVLVYGIPEFRLPKSIVSDEIKTLQKMGVHVRTNFLVGRTRKLTDLLKKDNYDAIFVGTGAGLPRFMNIEGENLVGIYSANEYLTRSNLMRAYDTENADTPILQSKKIAVFGGGNVAMDAARTARRLGANQVHLIYRRSEKEMPARNEEIAHAKEEGIIFHLLENAKRFLGGKDGRVRAVECLRYELGEPDDSGRRRPVAIEGSEFEIKIDAAIVAIGNDSNPLIGQTTPGLDCNKWGNIITDEETGRTSLERIYAGGDIVLGAATVILAMGEGRKVAAAINKVLQTD